MSKPELTALNTVLKAAEKALDGCNNVVPVDAVINLREIVKAQIGMVKEGLVE